MKGSSFCYKLTGTIVVLIIALAIYFELAHIDKYNILIGMAIAAGISLVIGIICHIWENE